VVLGFELGVALGQCSGNWSLVSVRLMERLSRGVGLDGTAEQDAGADYETGAELGLADLAACAELGLADLDPPAAADVLPLRRAAVPTGRVVSRMDDPEVLRRVLEGLRNLP
jgi:hypothetical protein